MTRDQYLDWVRTNTRELARARFPLSEQQQIIYQLGLTQRLLADLCWIDSDNAYRVRKTVNRAESQTRPLNT